MTMRLPRTVCTLFYMVGIIRPHARYFNSLAWLGRYTGEKKKSHYTKGGGKKKVFFVRIVYHSLISVIVPSIIIFFVLGLV